jgi:hypothetical protein
MSGLARGTIAEFTAPLRSSRPSGPTGRATVIRPSFYVNDVVARDRGWHRTSDGLPRRPGPNFAGPAAIVPTGNGPIDRDRPPPERVVAQAVAAGAIEASPVGNEHGWRLGRIVDPFGHEWEIGKPLAAWPPA